MTTNEQFLDLIQMRMNGVIVSDKTSPELTRLAMAYTEVKSRMTEEDYNAWVSSKIVVVKSAEEHRADLIEAARIMNENRERQSH